MQKDEKTLSLRIKDEWLKKIATGEKTEEWRSFNQFYYKKFVDKNDKFKDFNKLYLYCGNVEGGGNQLLIELKKISIVQFMDKIPEGFKKGDEIFCLHLGKLIEKNF